MNACAVQGPFTTCRDARRLNAVLQHFCQSSLLAAAMAADHQQCTAIPNHTSPQPCLPQASQQVQASGRQGERLGLLADKVRC